MKIALGTAQFGLDYGISNKTGKMHKVEARKILQYAHKFGMETLDTASAYGNSEEVIGGIVGNKINNNSWNIITKTPNFKSNAIGSSQINNLLKSFELSRKKLGQKSIYSLLIHNCNNIFLPGGEKLLLSMDRLKKNGLIKKIGVSLYNNEQINLLLDNYSVDLVQLPVNILDQRLIENGQLKRLKDNGIEIHARSVFLQGLLLMPINNIPSLFEPILNTLKKFHKEAKEQNISALQLALSFVQSIHEIDKVVVGINTLKQLHEIIDVSSARLDINKFSHLSVRESTLLNPSNWGV
jgi:aryl-alcohol dehydrogenase-like predicted oxidoreductase